MIKGDKPVMLYDVPDETTPTDTVIQAGTRDLKNLGCSEVIPFVNKQDAKEETKEDSKKEPKEDGDATPSLSTPEKEAE